MRAKHIKTKSCYLLISINTPNISCETTQILSEAPSVLSSSSTVKSSRLKSFCSLVLKEALGCARSWSRKASGTHTAHNASVTPHPALEELHVKRQSTTKTLAFQLLLSHIKRHRAASSTALTAPSTVSAVLSTCISFWFGSHFS